MRKFFGKFKKSKSHSETNWLTFSDWKPPKPLGKIGRNLRIWKKSFFMIWWTWWIIKVRVWRQARQKHTHHTRFEMPSTNNDAHVIYGNHSNLYMTLVMYLVKVGMLHVLPCTIALLKTTSFFWKNSGKIPFNDRYLRTFVVFIFVVHVITQPSFFGQFWIF